MLLNFMLIQYDFFYLQQLLNYALTQKKLNLLFNVMHAQISMQLKVIMNANLHFKII